MIVIQIQIKQTTPENVAMHGEIRVFNAAGELEEAIRFDSRSRTAFSG